MGCGLLVDDARYVQHLAVRHEVDILGGMQQILQSQLLQCVLLDAPDVLHWWSVLWQARFPLRPRPCLPKQARVGVAGGRLLLDRACQLPTLRASRAGNRKP